MLMDRVNTILDNIEARDVTLYEHLERVAMYSFALARKLELSPKELEKAYFAGLLHDAGKVATKHEHLTDVERKVLDDQHYVLSHLMLNQIQGLEPVAELVFHHHERFDGQGVPHRLAGTHIPLLTRALTIADAYDKMRMHGMTFETAVDELRKHSGTQFDPALVEPFIQVLQEEELA